MFDRDPLLADVEGNLWLVELPFDVALLPYELDVCGMRWARKEELHVTVVNGPSALHAVEAHLGAEDGLVLVRRVVEAWRELPRVRFDELTWEFRRVSLGRNETLVAMCILDGHDALIARVVDLLGVPLEVPPAHVTLYTRGEPIGIATARELRERTTVLGEHDAAVLAEAIRAATR